MKINNSLAITYNTLVLLEREKESLEGSKLHTYDQLPYVANIGRSIYLRT